MKAFSAVLVGLAVISLSVLISADQDGRSCEGAVDVHIQGQGTPFEEKINTSEFDPCFLEFNESDRVEVKGKWYHMTDPGNVIKLNSQSEFDPFYAVYKSCEKSSSGYYFHDLVHSQEGDLSLDFFTDINSDYYIIIGGVRVDNETFNEGEMEVSISYTDAPTAYECSRAIEIDVLPKYVRGSTVASPIVTDSCQGMNQTGGIWYHVVGTGVSITAHTCSRYTDFDTVVSVHSKCGNVASDCIVMNDDTCGLKSVVTFPTEQGADYYIFVTGHENARGVFGLFLMERGYNEHGVCTQAIEINNVPFMEHASTYMLPAIHSYCQDGERRGVWFHIASVTTELMAMTCDSNAEESDTVIDVYDDCNASQRVGTNCVAHNDDYCGLNSAVVLHPSTTGYYIFVSGRSSEFEGQNFTLTVQQYRNQTNDRCWQGTPVFMLPVDYSGNTKDMKEETTLHCGQTPSVKRHGAWFHYTNPGKRDRLIGVTTCNAENVVNATIEVFNGCLSCYRMGTYYDELGCSNVSFLAKPGVNYSIFVSPIEGGADGYYHVDFYDDNPAWNQFCNRSFNVTNLPYYATGYSSRSTLSYSSCDGGKEWQGLWYRIKGTGKKLRAATVDGLTHFDSLLELHSDCPSAGGADTCLMMNDDTSHTGYASSLDFDTEDGKYYWLFVRGYKGESGLFSLAVYELSEPVNSKCTNAPRLLINRFTPGYTTYSTPSSGDCSKEERKGVWYTTSVKEKTTLWVSTCDSATLFDTDIEVYTGCAKDAGVGCVDHTHDFRCSRGTIISFEADANRPYYIFVTSNRTDLNETGLFRVIAIDLNRPNYTSSSSASASSLSPFISSSSSSEPDHGMEVVEILLIIFSVILVISVGFAVGCCIYKRPSSKSYFHPMDVPDGLDTAESSTYIAPEMNEQL